LIGILTFSFGLWVSNMLALVSDSFPANEVATVISWTGVGQQGGGSVFIAYIGWVLARGGAAPSYFPVFTVAAVLPIISFVFTLWLNRAPAESRPPIP
jgi:Na+/melibiose symporter-like transporter